MASGRLPSTSTLAAAWCNRLDQFCTQLQKNCTSLHAIVQRKPEPSRGEGLFLVSLSERYGCEDTITFESAAVQFCRRVARLENFGILVLVAFVE